MELVLIRNKTATDPNKAYKVTLRDHGPAETTYDLLGYVDEWTARILNGSSVTFLDFEPGDNYAERFERKQYPAVMEAWNNYKTLLDLAKK